MAGGEQHAGDREHPLTPASRSRSTVANDRRGEFQEAVVCRILRQALAMPGYRLEFGDRLDVATAVAADHHTCLGHSAGWSILLALL